jgi:hypothetical protein
MNGMESSRLCCVGMRSKSKQAAHLGHLFPARGTGSSDYRAAAGVYHANERGAEQVEAVVGLQDETRSVERVFEERGHGMCGGGSGGGRDGSVRGGGLEEQALIRVCIFLADSSLVHKVG